MTTKEAIITINGRTISSAQAMALRVAVANFMHTLQNDGLGDDQHGVEMTELYQKRLKELEEMMLGGLGDETEYVLSNEANAKHLSQSIGQLKKGEITERKLID